MEFLSSFHATEEPESRADLSDSRDPRGSVRFLLIHEPPPSSRQARRRPCQSNSFRPAANIDGPAKRAAILPANADPFPQFRRGKSFLCSPVRIFRASLVLRP